MIQKTKALILIGVIIGVLPLFGIVRQIKDIILYILGVLIILFSLSLRSHIKLLKLKMKRLEAHQETLVS